MPIAPKAAKRAADPVEAGSHIGTLFQIIYLGTQKQEWEGKVSEAPKVSLTFELPTVLKTYKEGEPAKPRIVSREFTFSMGAKSNLRKFIEGIEGITFLDPEAYAYDIDTLIGRSAILNLSITPKNYNKIITAAPLMKGMPKPDQVHESLIFDVNKFDEVKFNNLPEFIRDKIKLSPEYAHKDLEGEEVIQIEEGAKGRVIAKLAKVTELTKTQKKFAEESIPYPEEEIDPNDIPF